MARVHTAKAAKDYPDHGIKKGDTYYWWQLYKQPKRMSKERPRPSQLTGSAKLSAIYAVRENYEDDVAEADDVSVLLDVLGDTSDAESVAEEYEEAAENIRENFSESPTADECEEKAEAIREWIDEIESAVSEIESLDLKDFDGDEDEYLTAAREIAEAAVDSLSL